MGVDAEGRAWQHARRERRVIAVADVVESVRLMQSDEAGFIDRWRRLVNDVATEVLPRRAGRLVKSLGDGLLLEFANESDAVNAALDIHACMALLDVGSSPQTAMRLRIGVHVAEIVIDALDVYGAGVNLAARLGTLAAPGETVVSVEVRDALTDGLDAEVEDLGECFLKHIEGTVRAYRISRGAALPSTLPAETTAGLPAIAVMPFSVVGGGPDNSLVGEAIAEELISQLAHSQSLRVIARLSTSPLGGVTSAPKQISSALGAQYVLQGSVRLDGDAARVVARLSDAAAGEVLWSESFKASLRDVLQGDDPLAERILAGVLNALTLRSTTRVQHLPLPTLDAYALLFGAVGLMHSASAAEFGRSREALEHLADRTRRLPTAHAWLGTWHVLRVVRGWSDNTERDAALALSSVDRALDVDGTHSLAITMRGLVHGFMRKDLATAESCYLAAIDAAPSEPFAWLFLSTLRAWQDRGAEASAAARQAAALSPLDPLRYYHQSMAAFAALAEDRLDEAVTQARQSLRGNRLHTATHRTLAVALMLGGNREEARKTVAEMLALEPGFNVARYRQRYPGGDTARMRLYADALADAGAPRGP